MASGRLRLQPLQPLGFGLALLPDRFHPSTAVVVPVRQRDTGCPTAGEVAYKLWVELSTRKLGLPIDLEHDVIVEIYTSWHEFFRVTRELFKEIAAGQLRNNKSSRDLVGLAIKVLNQEMRSHLTQWQTRFAAGMQLSSITTVQMGSILRACSDACRAMLSSRQIC